jgi:hypothetical protein
MLGAADPLDKVACVNLRFLILLVKWLASAVAYFVFCLALSLTLVLFEMRLVNGDDDSAALGLVMIVQLVPVLLICLFWGVIYASAVARSNDSEMTRRTLEHWGLSFLLGLLSCVSLMLIIDFRLPDFRSSLAVSAYLFAAFGFSIVCFVLGLTVRFRLSFREKQTSMSRKGPRSEIGDFQS